MKEIIVANDLASAKHPEDLILAEAARLGYCESVAFAIKLALEEAMTNAVRHGNCGDPTKRVRVRYRLTVECAVIEVEDEGCGFEPATIPDPTLPEYIDRPNGRGIMLMRAYLDEVAYLQRGTVVRMLKWNR